MSLVATFLGKLRRARHLLPGREAVACLLGAAAILGVLLATGPTHTDPLGPFRVLAVAAALIGIVLAVLWRFEPHHPIASRLILLASGLAFLLVAWDVIRLLNHATMASAWPLADDLLAGWDEALGLNWRSYFDWVSTEPQVRDVMAYSYTSLTLLSLLIFLIMCLVSAPRRPVFFLETFTFTAIFCTLAGAFFPARAAVDRYLGKTADLSAFPVEPGLYHLDALERLRSGASVELVLGSLPGLVTFPSFHTAAGVILVTATRRSWLVVPAAPYAVVMIASTPVYGGHYFVDLFAGAVVALGIAWLWARHPKNAGLFAVQGQRADRNA